MAASIVLFILLIAGFIYLIYQLSKVDKELDNQNYNLECQKKSIDSNYKMLSDLNESYIKRRVTRIVQELISKHGYKIHDSAVGIINESGNYIDCSLYLSNMEALQRELDNLNGK